MHIVLKASTYQRLYDFYGEGFCADGLPILEGHVMLDLPAPITKQILDFGLTAGLYDFDEMVETMIGLQTVCDRGVKRA